MNVSPPIQLAVVAGAFAIVGTLVGAWTNSSFTLSNQLRATKMQQRAQAYSDISAEKVLLQQLYVSRFEAYIFSDYYEYIWDKEGCPKSSLSFQEMERNMLKSEDLALQLAQSRKSLFKAIGMASMSFPTTPELKEKIDRIYKFKMPVTTSPKDLDPSKLETWKMVAVASLQNLVEQEYGVPIDDLLNYLQANINAR